MELYVSFSEILHFFKRNRVKFILVVLTFGIVMGLLPLKLAKPSYSANTTFVISCEIPENADTDYRLQYTSILNSRVQTVIALAGSHDLLKQTAAAVGVSPSEIKSIAADQLNGAPVIKLTASTPDAAKAAPIADAAAGILARDMEQQFPSPKLTVAVQDPAVPQGAQSTKSAMAKAGLFGMALGFILYICYGIIAVLCDRTVRNSRFVEQELHVGLLAEIPHDGGDRAKDDAFRRMRAAALHRAKEARTFLVAGVCPSDAGAAAAAGFAKALAQTGRKVLLVDADFRGAPAALPDLKMEKTLADVLAGACGAQDAAVAVPSHPGLYFLSAGKLKGADPADAFAGAGFEQLMGQAASGYDYVVVAAPAEAAFPDADNIAPRAQATILAVRYGSTPFAKLKESLLAVASAGGSVAGFVTADV